MEPADLPALSERTLRDLLLDYVAERERRGHAGSDVYSAIKAVQSWLLHNGVRPLAPQGRPRP